MLEVAVDDLRRELDRRAHHSVPVLVVVPELGRLGQYAAGSRCWPGVGSASSSFHSRLVGSGHATRDCLTPHLATRLVLHMQRVEASVTLLGVADAAFLSGGRRLFLRLTARAGRVVRLSGRREHLERLIRVMHSAYPSTQPQASSRLAGRRAIPEVHAPAATREFGYGGSSRYRAGVESTDVSDRRAAKRRKTLRRRPAGCRPSH